MSYKTLKIVAILAVIFGIVGIGWGWKVQYAANHPSKSDASWSSDGSPSENLAILCDKAGGKMTRIRRDVDGQVQYFDECIDSGGNVIGGERVYLPPKGN